MGPLLKCQNKSHTPQKKQKQNQQIPPKNSKKKAQQNGKIHRTQSLNKLKNLRRNRKTKPQNGSITGAPRYKYDAFLQRFQQLNSAHKNRRPPQSIINGFRRQS